jgi:hypothetical protein
MGEDKMMRQKHGWETISQTINQESGTRVAKNRTSLEISGMQRMCPCGWLLICVMTFSFVFASVPSL